MNLTWEVDAATVVEARIGGLGKQEVIVNGQVLVRRRSLRAKSNLEFALPDGRQVRIAIAPRTGMVQPSVELRVADQLFAPNGKEPFKCASCGAASRPYDRFCDGCGKALPSAEERQRQHQHRLQVGESNGAIRGLAWLFAIFGAISFFLNLWGALITNLILAAVMVGLAQWGKRAPFPAMIVATATYAVVVVSNAMLDPKSIGQGIFMKILIVGLLVRGVRSALALRAADA